MRKSVLVSSLLLGCLLIFSCCAIAQDQASSPAPDARLLKKITLAESRITLDELLKKASEQAGVTMRADKEQKAWKVRELPVSVQLKDITVSSFQQTIAKLLDLRWMRTGETDKWIYTIWQDKNARERETLALEQKKEEKINKLYDKWREGTDAMAKVASLTPEELAKAKEQYPFLKFAMDDPLGKPYVQLLMGLGPAAISSAAEGQEFRVGYSQLPPFQQQNVQGFVTGLHNLMSRMPGGESELGDVDWSRVSVEIKPVPSGAGGGAPDRMGFLGMLMVSGGGMKRPSVFPILDHTNPMANMLADGVVKVTQGTDPKDVMQQVGQAMQSMMKGGGVEGDSSSQRMADSEPPTDPKLQKEVEIKPGDTSDIGSALAGLVEQAGINIFAEAWKQPGVGAVQDKGTVEQVLNRTAKRFIMKWDYTAASSAVRIKSDDWAAKRAAMVPAAELKYWADKAEEKGTLGLDDLAELASTYTQEQIMGMMASNDAIAHSAWPLAAGDRRKAIAFYGTLKGDALSLAKSDLGIPAVRLSDEQHESLISVLDARGVSPDDFFVTGSRVILRESANGSSLTLIYPPDKTLDIRLTMPSRPAPPAVPPQTAPKQTAPKQAAPKQAAPK